MTSEHLNLNKQKKNCENTFSKPSDICLCVVQFNCDHKVSYKLNKK